MPETTIMNMQTHIDSLQKRLSQVEKLFTHLMQLQLRLDTLEFNSELPVQPSSAERLASMERRQKKLESLLRPVLGERFDKFLNDEGLSYEG